MLDLQCTSSDIMPSKDRKYHELFKAFGSEAPINYAISGNEITICMEPEDVETYVKAARSQQAIDAMISDGLKVDTVKIVVLDKEWKVYGSFQRLLEFGEVLTGQRGRTCLGYMAPIEINANQGDQFGLAECFRESAGLLAGSKV